MGSGPWRFFLSLSLSFLFFHFYPAFLISTFYIATEGFDSQGRGRGRGRSTSPPTGFLGPSPPPTGRGRGRGQVLPGLNEPPTGFSSQGKVQDEPPQIQELINGFLQNPSSSHVEDPQTSGFPAEQEAFEEAAEDSGDESPTFSDDELSDVSASSDGFPSTILSLLFQFYVF